MTFRPEIVIAAGKHGIDPDLGSGLVEQESAYDQYAYNPEPRYRWFWDVKQKKPFRAVTDAELAAKFPPHDFPSMPGTDNDQEWWAQQASWGLTQIMGAVARERGFLGTYLTELTNPQINLDYGFEHLALLFKWAESRYTGQQSGGGKVRAVRLSALAAYNGGTKGNAPFNVPLRNKTYALAVLARYERIRGARA